jgi:hypothetical protein
MDGGNTLQTHAYGFFLPRKRRGVIGAAVAALLIVTFGAPATVAHAAANCSAGKVMNFVAHEDDDLLFLSPDLRADIVAGRCVRTVYLTAGDAGADDWYWQAREEGERDAYAQMVGGSGTWVETDAGISGHPIPVFTFTGNERVSLAFIRLPDGLDGSGSPAQGNKSLKQLEQGTISTITTVNDAAPSTYTKAQLLSTLTALMTSYGPSTIRTQDHAGSYDDGDHNDHYASARLVNAAKAGYPSGTLVAYYGYRTQFYPANVSGSTLTGKKNAFYAYGANDGSACSSDATCAGTPYEAWLQRQYRINTGNVASQATATASSADASTQQTADKAIDGAIDGYPGDSTKEWATVFGLAGSWIQLTWPSARTVKTIVLYDRPNLADQITGATLTFSSGSPVNVTSLDNSGIAKVITLSSARSVTWIKLQINSVSANTVNTGLAEFETYTGAGP